ncbi:MAG: hypothetical protein LBB43_07375, partial [Spirochaetaceae bacterium]|nr:hypothetical protein [Spirochaetaceae bacterium]
SEKIIIRDTLSFCNGNKSKTAALLGIGRKTLHRKLGKKAVNIVIPPPRERKDDISLLIAFFLKELAAENNKTVENIDEGWLPFPISIDLAESKKIIISDTLSFCNGNKSKTAALLAIGKKTLHRKLGKKAVNIVIPPPCERKDDISLLIAFFLKELAVENNKALENIDEGCIPIPINTSLEESEKIIIRDTLSFCNGNKSKTAALLAIGRKTLHRKLGKKAVNIVILPPCERKNDIPLLIAFFLKELAAENNKTVENIDEKARAALYAYDWPGNVRELRNCIESAVVMAKGNVITQGDLPPTIHSSAEEGWIRIPIGTDLEESEKIIIRDTLSFCNGNKSKTAALLGIGRKTLHRKLGKKDEDLLDEE